ncbi:SCO2400 family protein [Streptomyces kanasensis]|uniref:SCO2400 family protein n=1 Tax=Streptomyces kanasensis TaxID=936756 RepID=UPI003827E247
MDYCHQCQRHLNGALACAGCGTPVEELRHDDPQPSAADHVFELARDEQVPPAASGRAQARQARSGKARSGKAPSGGDPSGSRRAGRAGGRRARRRRGRNVLLGVTGLVLAAGALSLAELAMEHPADDGAATAVRQEDAAQPEPLPVLTPSAGRPEGPDEVRESPSASDPGADPSASADGAGAGDATGGPDGTATAPGEGDGTGVDGGAGQGQGKGGLKNPTRPGASPDTDAPEPPRDAPSEPAEGDPDPDPTPTPPADDPAPEPPPSPSPAPSPTKSCTPWLWWCF